MMISNRMTSMLSFPLADRVISTANPAFVVGIVNATPDSFYGKSCGSVDYAMKLVEEGADILDIGAESSRPGSSYVSVEEELNRLIPFVEQIRKRTDVPISIDTRKLIVFEHAFEAGCDILNDVSALEDDDGLAKFAAEKKVPVILMHKNGVPSKMQNNPEYDDVFSEVNLYLEQRIEYAVSCGISREKIIIDPGIGFGKKLDDNVNLIKNCGKLCGGKYNVMMALSRKTCVGEMTGKDVDGRLYGTLALNVVSVINGATFVRVHDVSETVDTLKVLRYTF